MQTIETCSLLFKNPKGPIFLAWRAKASLFFILSSRVRTFLLQRRDVYFVTRSQGKGHCSIAICKVESVSSHLREEKGINFSKSWGKVEQVVGRITDCPLLEA